MTMAYSSLHLPIQHIRHFFPREKPAIDTTKSARHYGRGNKQHQGIPRRLFNTHTYKYWSRTDNIITDKFTLIGQWKFDVHGVEPRRKPARTPCADDDKQVINGTDGIFVCAAAQPRQLSANNGNCPRTSAQN